jgi:REP element-mobilizing transposase RayT
MVMPRMGRALRPNIPGGTYHVMNRGNRKESIFADDCDRRQFLRTLIEEQAIHGVKILGGTLMKNHLHLVVVTLHGNLSDFMEQQEGRFARYSNWRHQRVGHLFQGPFRHVLIESDIHLLTALCYVFMNPVAAGQATQLESYKWSTYAATAGYTNVPAYLSIDWLEALFPNLPLVEAQQRLRQTMGGVRPVVTYVREMELYVGPATIHEVIRSYTAEQFDLSTMPRVYRTALRPSLNALLLEAAGDRPRSVWEARVSYGYRNVEIGESCTSNQQP